MQGIPEDKVFSEKDLERIRSEANVRFPEMELRPASMYEHPNGVLVEGMEGRWWVTFKDKDDYDWALWKVLKKLLEKPAAA